MNSQEKQEWWTSLSELWQEILLMNRAIDKKLKESKTPNFSAFVILTDRYERVLKKKFKIGTIPVDEQTIDDILRLDNISCSGFPITNLHPIINFNLLHLSISGTSIIDINEVSVFANLEFLELGIFDDPWFRIFKI